MFMGEYQHSIDDKGRLIIPAKFRDGLGASFVVTRGLVNCLPRLGGDRHPLPTLDRQAEWAE